MKYEWKREVVYDNNPFPSCLFSSVSYWVFVRNQSNGNEFPLPILSWKSTYYRMKGFARELVFEQTHKLFRKCLIRRYEWSKQTFMNVECFLKLVIPKLWGPFDREWRNGRVKLAYDSRKGQTRELMQTLNLALGKYV